MNKYVLMLMLILFASLTSCQKEDALAVDVVNAELARSFVGYSYTWTTLFNPDTGERFPNDTTFNVEMPDYSFKETADGFYGLVRGDADPDRSDLTASQEQLSLDTIVLSMPNRPISKFTFYRNEGKVRYLSTTTNGSNSNGTVALYIRQ